MRDTCFICDGTGKAEDGEDPVTSMHVCGNCGGTGELVPREEPMPKKDKPVKETPMFDIEAMKELRVAFNTLHDVTCKMASPSVRDAVDALRMAINRVEVMVAQIMPTVEKAIEEAAKAGYEEGRKPSLQDTRQCGTCKSNGVAKCCPPFDGSACPHWEMVEPASVEASVDMNKYQIEALQEAMANTDPSKFGSVDALFAHLKQFAAKKTEGANAASEDDLKNVDTHRQMPILEAAKIIQEVYDATTVITDLNKYMHEQKNPTRYVWSYVSNQTVDCLPGCYFLIWKIEQKQPGEGTTAKLVFKGPVNKMHHLLLDLKFPKDLKRLSRLVYERK